MKPFSRLLAVLLACTLLCSALPALGESEVISIPEDVLYDKLQGGWIGQMLGVSWAASTEFGYRGVIMPLSGMPIWSPAMINDAFAQDDLYVEIPFMEAMQEHGAECDGAFLAEKLRTSQFPLWHANLQARENLRSGISYPDSGHYANNCHADDIDWQIECDFLGMMYPGLVNRAAQQAFAYGHIMNYGDGVYGGVFVSAMHAAAYTAASVEEIVNAGLQVIPDGTLFKDVMNDVMASYHAGDSWQENWQKLEDKWAATDRCPECIGPINIDAKLNSAYILIGLLYGGGDMKETILISTRCGQDSDCNPSSAASILGSFYGAQAINDRYKRALDADGRVFSNTRLTLNDALALNFRLMQEALQLNGAVRSDAGVWTIPADAAYTPVPFEQWPAGMDVLLTAVPAQGLSVKLTLTSFGTEAAQLTQADMGDGTVLQMLPALYTYREGGDYTIRCTLTGESGSTCTVEKTIHVDAPSRVPGQPFCSVTQPTGGGCKDIAVIYDGVTPASDGTDAMQYDTFAGGLELEAVDAGVVFDVPATLTAVRFQEGKHFGDGGWFDASPVVEVLLDGEWQRVSTVCTPAYPDPYSHGAPFETYTFTLEEPILCGGVRITGKPGGAAHFISIGEITPVTVEQFAAQAEALPIIICSVSTPTGGGSKDISIICDGVIPDAASARDSMQYDTYTGGPADVPAYVGYLYPEGKTVSQVAFTEGNHFGNGGWFSQGDLHLELYIGGEWIRPQTALSPDYPNGSVRAGFGSGYETYVFTLAAPTLCEGVRLMGTAGGGFISISELTVE